MLDILLALLALQDPEVEDLKRRVAELERRAAQEPAAANPDLGLAKKLGLDDFEVHALVRPRFNYYDNLITLGRDTGAPAFSGHDDAGLYFLDFRAWLEIRARSGPFSLGLRVDIGGNDFNDGGMLGNDSDVANSNLGIGPAGLRDFDVDLGQAWVAWEDSGWKAEVGRLPFSLHHGILTRIQRDAIRLSKKEGGFSIVAAWIFGAQGGRSIDGDEGLSGDDSAVKYTSDSIGEFNTATLLAGYEFSREFKASLFAAKQLDSTKDDRFTEKLFFDAAAFYAGSAFEFSFEGVTMDGKGARSAALGERPDLQAYALFVRFAVPLGESGVKPGLAAGIGSGDSTPANDESNGIENLFVDELHFTYTYVYADDLHGYNGSASSLRRASGFANTWFVQPHVRWAASKDLDVTFSYTYLRAVRAQAEGLGPLGDSFAGRGNYGLDPAMRADATDADRTKDVGDEFDVLTEYRATKQVRVLFNVGVFFPGRIFGDDAHTAWKGDLGLEFKF
jgi:hypothetical protein